MPGARHALIVATDEYQDASLRGLSSPASDAQALAGVLGDPELGEFEVEVLHNWESRDIALRLEELLTDRRPADVVLIHFSCHGLKDDSGQLYLAAADTLPNRLWSTAVDATFVNRLIRKSRAGQVVLLLDCCYGGAFERGMVARAAGDVDVGEQFQQAELSPGRGRAVVTASSAMEYAFEGSHLQDGTSAPAPSVFTSALTEGLRTGDADRGQDGMVDLGELYDYVYDRVREVNPRQTPSKWEYGTQGDLVIARNPNRRLAKATLPDALLSLVNDPFAATRHGAVEELRKLVVGTNLPLAATARAELVRLQSDDSRVVSTAATAVLRDTQIATSEDHVELGTVQCGAVATHVFELTGVPLVDASRARVEGEGIDVHQVGRRVTVELDTAEPRIVNASVVVEGPTGEATVSVHGVVLRATTVPIVPDPSPPKPAPPEPTPPGPTTPEPTPPKPTPPRPTPPIPPKLPTDPAVVRRRRAFAGAAVILLGSLASLLTLGLDWTADGDPPGPPGEQLATWGAVTYLLPLAVVTVGGVLILARGAKPLRLGITAGAAVVTLVVMGQQLVRFMDPDAAWRPSGGFWVAVVCRLVLVIGVVIAALGLAPEEQRVRLTFGPMRVVAAVVVVIGILLADARADDIEILVISHHQLEVAMYVGLVVGLAASFLALPELRRRAFLAAVTTLCLLMSLSDLWLYRNWVDSGRLPPRWQLIDAVVWAFVLVVALLVQGLLGRRSSSASRPSSAG